MRIDVCPQSIVAAWYRLAPFEQPGSGFPINMTEPHAAADARNPASKPTIFQGAVEGHVLVKNINNALPLKRPKPLSLFGYDAYAPLRNDPPASDFGKWSLGLQSVNIVNESDILFISWQPTILEHLRSLSTGH